MCQARGNYGPAMLPSVPLALLGVPEPPALGLLCWLLVGSAMFVVSLSRSRAIRALPAALSTALLAGATVAYGAPIIEVLLKL